MEIVPEVVIVPPVSPVPVATEVTVPLENEGLPVIFAQATELAVPAVVA
jgi:hypothetical protein